jgi:adenosylcobinamide-GDP ribazoletransferase
MIRRLRTDLAVAIGFLTRLPVSALMPREPRIDMAGAVWVFPVAGAIVGLCGGAAYALLCAVGLSPALCGCWSAAAMLLLTGALHEDGLADMADGFGGGRDVPRKLEIMRDSRIGSYGALALLLSSLVRVAAMAGMAAPWRVCAALVVSGALSRAAIVLVLLLLRPARRDGLASPLHPIPRLPAFATVGMALAVAAALLRGRAMLVAPVCALTTALLVALLARRQIGGHTGDVLGACAVLADCAVLSGLSAR